MYSLIKMSWLKLKLVLVLELIANSTCGCKFRLYAPFVIHYDSGLLKAFICKYFTERTFAIVFFILVYTLSGTNGKLNYRKLGIYAGYLHALNR